MGLFENIWKGIRRMFGYTTLKTIVGKDVALSSRMIDAINDWKSMLTGNAEWLTESIQSLRIEQGICREFADVVLSEMETSVSSEKLDKIYQKCLTGLNENLQDGLGLGQGCHGYQGIWYSLY